MRLKRIFFRVFVPFLLGMFFEALPLPAQDAPSVAEAARRARAQKESASKPSKVVTNDTLPPARDAAAGSAAGPGNAASPQALSADDADTQEEAEKKKEEISALKQEIAEKQQSVDLLQREIALEQDNLYSKPEYQRDSSAKEKLNSLASDLKHNQDELAALKAKLADAGGAAKESAPAAPPPATTSPQT